MLKQDRAVVVGTKWIMGRKLKELLIVATGRQVGLPHRKGRFSIE
jgi:hypothetical protein